MPEIKETKAHCNTCGGERNHKTLCSEESSWQHQETNISISGTDKYEMLKCSGCGSIKLRHIEWCSANHDEDGNLVPTIDYYPSSIFRPSPRWLLDFMLEVDFFNDGNPYNLLIEIYVALRNDQRALAAMGIRALLESIMIEKVGDQGTFSANLKKFAAAGYVSRMQLERLETILEAGHAAIHRLYKPSEEDLITLVDITESIVESIYIHGKKVEKLKGKIPSRARKDKPV